MATLARFQVGTCMKRPLINPKSSPYAKVSQEDVDGFFNRFHAAIKCNIIIQILLYCQAPLSFGGFIAGIVLKARDQMTPAFFIAFLVYKIFILITMLCNRASRQNHIEKFLETENSSNWKMRGANWVCVKPGCCIYYMELHATVREQDVSHHIPIGA